MSSGFEGHHSAATAKLFAFGFCYTIFNSGTGQNNSWPPIVSRFIYFA